MKLSNNSIGMLIFIALATTVFVLMVLRPAVDGNAMNLGVPMTSEIAASDTIDQTEVKTTETQADPATEQSPAAVIVKDEISEEELSPNTEAETEESPSAEIIKEEIIEEAPSETAPTTTD